MLETVIRLENYANNCLEIQGAVLQSDGSDLAVLINAVSIAVAHAGIEMSDLAIASELVSQQGLLTDTIIFVR